MKARYLLRFDDLCPTMNWHVWDAVEAILCKQHICPLLAVVPDNQDDHLRVSPPNPHFWDRVREWQARGWTIALHGWQHRFVTKESGILRVNQFSEFAGLSRTVQEQKLICAREVFQSQAITSEVFVAPAHTFDVVTLQLLVEQGFRYISDGYFHAPLVDEFGLVWVPQQLWSYRRRPFGLWTICFHTNSWQHADILAFKEQTERYRPLITKFSTAVERVQLRRKSIVDVAIARIYRTTIRILAFGKAKTKSLCRNFGAVSQECGSEVRPNAG